MKSVEAALAEAGWDLRLQRLHPKGIRPHSRLRIAIASCPNGCSQPHIHDIALIAASRPRLMTPDCTGCGLCVKNCREGALFVQGSRAVTRDAACLGCGECTGACPAHAIHRTPIGFRLLLGGHMGRHPAWATELHGLYPPERVADMIRSLASLLVRHARESERPSQTFARLGFAHIAAHLGVERHD